MPEPPSHSTAPPQAGPPSSPPARFLFRAASIYFILYLLPFPLNEIGLDSLVAWYHQLWFALIPWAGRAILHLDQPITVFPNGSGDTTFNYIQVLCFAVIAFGGAVLWTLIDPRRPSHPRLFPALRIYIRYALAAALLSYGITKLFANQFPTPGPGRLLQPFGHASPMGLLWTFIGASTPYQVFCGAAEVLPGLLLLFRRTTTLGALIAIAVMTDVFLLNLCYDVPVKLFSLHLLILAVFLTLPDAARLVDFFILNRPTSPAPLRTPRPRLHAAACSLAKALLILVLIGPMVGEHLNPDPFQHTLSLSGAYDVVEFERDGAIIPPLLSEHDRWRRISFSTWGTMVAHPVDAMTHSWRAAEDLAAGTLILSSRSEPAETATLTCARDPDGTLTLAGPLDDHTIRAVLKPAPAGSFLLNTRGFHWISERPFNR